MRFHDFRHSHATIAIQDKIASPKTVQQRLGHLNISTTLAIYTAATEAQEQKISEEFDL